jgi:hypothetical protein
LSVCIRKKTEGTELLRLEIKNSETVGDVHKFKLVKTSPLFSQRLPKTHRATNPLTQNETHAEMFSSGVLLF